MKILLFSRCLKKESDLANALIQWKNIESALISKEAEYSKLLSEKRSLNHAFTDLQDKMENVCTSNRGVYCAAFHTSLCVCLCV